jgi:uncharacterized membrane protein
MSEANKPAAPSSFLHKLRSYFTTGLLVLAPTAVTVWVLLLIFQTFDGILGKIYTRVFEYFGFEFTHIPGLGAVTLAIIVTLFGYTVRFYAGRKLFEVWEKLINRLPLLNKVYVATRQISDVFTNPAKMNMGRPVMMEYPRKGVYSIGYITDEDCGYFSDLSGKKLIGVYLPTTPNPTSGMLIYVPEEELIPLDASSEEIMKLIISAGVVGLERDAVPRIES